MSSSPIKFWNSVVIRFALFFSGLILCVILLSGYLVFRKSSVVIIDTAKERLAHSVDLAEQSFQAQLNEVSNDIAMLSDNLALRNFVNQRSNQSANDLSQLFASTLANKPDYFQIRLLDEAGKEVIRYDKKDNQILRVAVDDLQQKGGRDYFQEAIAMKKGEYYFSRINLNEEYGVISSPAIVTLRAASPIFNEQNLKVGILVINVDLDRFYKQLSGISPTGVFSLLVDQDGTFLYHPNHDKEFSKQRGTHYNLSTDYDITLANLNEGNSQFNDTLGNHYITYLRTIKYMNGNRSVYLISAVDENILLQNARQVRKESLQNLTLVCLISLLFSYLFTRLFSEQINQVTRAIGNYEDGQDYGQLPVDRKDEIGLLARSFNTMRLRVDQTLKDLNKSLKEEKKAKAQRDEFLQNMSHELRTPLHTILGLTSLLKKNKPTEAQRPIIASLEKSAENLSGLVYDVLDHQKLLEGKLLVQYKAVCIGDLLDDIYSNYQYEALQKGLKFSKNLEPKLYENAHETDPLRLSQIVTNLLVNAIKYTEQGEISIVAKLVEIEGPQLQVSIADTGIGITNPDLLKINDLDFRETPELVGRHGSYGLGLSIVKQLISLLGGSLKAVSQRGKGSTFSFLIPVKSLEAEENLGSTPRALISKGPKLKHRPLIMHIDDDQASLEFFSYLMDKDNFHLQQFRDFEPFRQAIKKQQPDLLVTDLILHQKDIQEEILQLKTNQSLTCPIIVVSAKDRTILKEISPYYFQKPFEAQLLVDQIYILSGIDLYQKPDFEYLTKNYDHNRSKINRALDLLAAEFESYITRIDQLRQKDSHEEWLSITHKLITHAKSLKLQKVISNLDSKSTPNPATLDSLKNSLKYALCCIRMESWINSRD